MNERLKKKRARERASRKERVKDWLARKRAWLIEQMGGRCSNPKCKAPLLNLEFHHKERRTWVCRNINQHRRMARYVREWKEGKLELLCAVCNKKKGKPPPLEEDFVPPPEMDSEVPF